MKGSTFTLTIETGSLDGVALLDAPTEVSTRTETAQSGAANVKLACRVLLAEDGPDNQRLISLLLKRAGAELAIALNGQEAMELTLAAERQGQPFDVVLMDIQMPVVDGYEAARRLREAGYSRPIIALTAHAMNEDRQKCLDVGCDDYLSKPIDREKLLALVARYAVGRSLAR